MMASLPDHTGLTLPEHVQNNSQTPDPEKDVEVASFLSSLPGGEDPAAHTSRDSTCENSTMSEAVVERGDPTQMPPLLAEMSCLFQDVKVIGSGSGATYQDSVGESLLLPVKIAQKLLSQKREPEKLILRGIDGVLRAGEMLLVLGRPGSGCSTLLKNLAGFDEGYVRCDGNIRYNGIDIGYIKTQFRGDVLYCSEVETHFPHLTVTQTLAFAIEARTPNTQGNRSGKQAYMRDFKEDLASTFGLSHTLGTKVGDDYVRGVSGGERKRVSLAEVLASRGSVCFWDNPTRGLDASTSLEFADTIRRNTKTVRTTAIVAAYQAGENFTLMFDKVTVLYLGHQIFFGALADAQTHFHTLGFQRKPRQTSADFLTSITDPTARLVRVSYENRVPQSPEEFVSAWKTSSYYLQLQQQMSQYKVDFSDEGAELHKLKQRQALNKGKQLSEKSPYLTSVISQFRNTIKRSSQRLLGDRAFFIANIFSAIYMSLINGSVFFNTQPTTSGFFSKGGVIFFSVLFNALQTMSEVATQYAQRPIIHKHYRYALYHPFVDSLAAIFADLPVKLLNTLLFDVILYFMVGLRKDVGAFFIFVLVTYLTTVALSGIFKTVAAATKQSETASGIAGVLVLILAIYTGYVIPIPSMHPWFSWLRYINPISYGFEALMVNEFHGQNGQCTNLVPSGPGYGQISIQNQVCAVTGARPGLPFVNGDDYLRMSFGYEYANLWRNVGIIAAFIVFFVITCAIATEFNLPAPETGDLLVFRKGHEPKHVTRSLEMGAVLEDVEHGKASAVLTTAVTNVSGFHGLVKSTGVFTWENINYDIVLSDGTIRRLLDNVSGYAKPGTLTALMGESGAGKTTLLNVLAQRIDTGVITGNMSVNGFALPKAFQRRTGYVQQQDVHIAESTVREALRFSALLRQTADNTIQEKYDYVERVIQMLEMGDYAEAVIGTPGNGLSVEQRKRTTIGIELVAKPALLLFLDEPTSGLDSQSAWSIVRLLRKLANSGQAILCTIHQPSSVLFEKFDRLLLLKKGGRVTYSGNIGPNSRDVIKYFETQGAPSCEPQENAAEYILGVIGAGASAKSDRDWAAVWEGTPGALAIMDEIHALKEEFNELSHEDKADDSNETFAMPWFTQYKAVQTRVFQNYWRNPGYINSKMFLNIVAGLFLGFTFYQEGDSIQGMQNKLFAIFMALILAISLMNQLQPRWDALSSLYQIREKPSKIYHWSTFVLSNITAEIPYNLCGGTLFFVIWYFATGLSKPFSGSLAANRGIYEWILIMLFELWWSTFGQAIAALSPNPQTASILSTLFASFVITFNGVLQPLSALPQFWHWMYYLSPYTWLISGLTSNMISGVPVNCAAKELNVFNPPNGQTCQEFAGAFLRISGKLLNPDAMTGCQYCRYSNGDQYLKTLTISFDERWRNVGFLFAYVIFNIAATFLFFYATKIVQLNTAKLVLKRKKP